MQSHTVNTWHTKKCSPGPTQSPNPAQRRLNFAKRENNQLMPQKFTPPLLFILNIFCLKIVRYKMKRPEFYNFPLLQISYCEICSKRREGTGVQIASIEVHIIKHHLNSGQCAQHKFKQMKQKKIHRKNTERIEQILFKVLEYFQHTKILG